MCTTSFPSRSIESFCLLFSSFYDLTPKGAAKGRNNQNAPISGGGGNMEMQGRENVCPEVWQHGATGKSVGRGRDHNYYCYYNVIKKIFIFLSLAGAHDRFLWNA